MAGSLADVPYATRRPLEICTAVAIGVVGAVVALESLTHDIAWNEAGPGSGYFPFRVGLLVIGVALIQVVRGTGSANDTSHVSGPVASGPAEVFVTRDELRRSLSVFWPTAALVAAMFLLGAYVPSAAYLAWMMRRHGGRGRLTSAAYGAVVMVVFFLIFDVWFGVPLASGPLDVALSFTQGRLW